MSLHADIRADAGALVIEARLEARSGEVVGIVGPNGAGKTTVLKAIAGLWPISRGKVSINEWVVEDSEAGIRNPPEQRSVGMVFQDLRLFPHMSVADNIGYGLRLRGVPRKQARVLAEPLIETLGLAPHSKQKPGSLSGGQAQKVALARTLITNPQVILLDEPFSALDAESRPKVRRDMSLYFRHPDCTTIIVTHDPMEAKALCNRVIVMEEGRFIQEGEIDRIADDPKSRYAAESLGLNFFPGVAAGETVDVGGEATLSVVGEHHGRVIVSFHPRAVVLHQTRPEGTARNVFKAIVRTVRHENGITRVTTAGSLSAVAEITRVSAEQLNLRPGAEVWLSVKAAQIQVTPL